MTTEETTAADRGSAGNNLLGLVERLRELSRRGHWPLIGDEAADEIERLRAALTLAANRMDVLALDHEYGTTRRYIADDWAKETRAALWPNK